MSSTRVVITGYGAVSPFGLTADELWEGLNEGKCGIKEIEAFDASSFQCKYAGEVPDFKVRKFVPKKRRKATKLMSRDIELAVVAAKEAVEKSGLVTKGVDPEKVNVSPERMSINLGSGFMSCDIEELAPAVAKSLNEGHFDIKKWGKDGMRMITPLWLLKYLPNMLACHVGIIHDIQGPSNTITCAEASGHLAMAEAAQTIIRGKSDIAFTGAAEAKVQPILITKQCLLKRANTDLGSPDELCRPFDSKANGAIFGEGGGIIIMEEIEHARSRETEIFAELAGLGHSNSLSEDFEFQEESGEGIRLAIEMALEDAEISAEDIDLIIPHGTAVPADDLAEGNAIQDVFGYLSEKPALWPTKSMLSHTGAAASILDVISGIYSINNGIIPAAKNCDSTINGFDFNISGEKRRMNIRNVLCISYTFGGQTAAVVLKKYE